MKSIIKLFFIGLSVFLYSCDDSLVEPFTPGVLTEEIAVRTPADLSRLSNGIYVALTNRTHIEFTSVFTDEVAIGTNNGGQGINDNYGFFVIPSSDSPNGIWNNACIILARCNKVITNADRLLLDPFISANTAQVAQVNVLKAEALTLRALAHLRLVGYFSPDVKNDASLGGILAIAEVPLDNFLPRATNGAIYAQVHTDLDKALTLFGSAAFAPTRANRVAARALKARAYALKGDYPNALIQANLTIAAAGAPALSTFVTYRSNFTDTANGEVILKMRRTINQSSQGTNIGNIYASVDSTISGSPFYEINRALYNAAPTGDIRKSVMIDPTSLIDPNYLTSTNYRSTDVLCVGKHAGDAARVLLNVDFKLIRMSEMHLIKAEAEIAAGLLVPAATTLKGLLDRRFAVAQPLPFFATAKDGWRFILNQRRLEFCFEGYRYIDLKRIGGAAFADLTIDRHPLDCRAGANCTLPITDYRFALPIPLSELNANPTIVQNPGY